MIKENKAQGLIEYGLILGIVTVALLSMQIYFKRGIQSVIRTAADDYGPQGERISANELAVKRAFLQRRGDVPMVSSTNEGSWTQRIENKGKGAIKSSLSGSDSVEATSTWLGGDYRRRMPRTEARNAPPSQ